MNHLIKEFIDYIEDKNLAPQHNKELVKKDCVDKFHLIKDRSVFYCEHFAVRFCYTKNNSFSNTVLSLSCLQKYDKIPFFVVLVKREGTNQLFLANTTFLKKISHSSMELSLTNIKGSFNGSDIMRECAGIENISRNFEELIAIHNGMEWNDNLQRLVDASSRIKSVNEKFSPSDFELNNIKSSIKRAKDFVATKDYSELLNDLNDRCNNVKDAILVASRIENVNIRGRLIEALITSEPKERQKLLSNLEELERMLPTYDTKNGLGDYVRKFNNDTTYTDIKTKIIYLDSAPKAFNIDKFLKCMAQDNTIFFFYFIGIDKDKIFNTILASVYHSELIQNTILQYHWAGRSSRGVAQYKGKGVNDMLREKKFQNNIDKTEAERYLKSLLER